MVILELVSILVLVDLAREYDEDYFSDIEDTSFNPCFSGSCSRISVPVVSVTDTLLFQSLF